MGVGPETKGESEGEWPHGLMQNRNEMAAHAGVRCRYPVNEAILPEICFAHEVFPLDLWRNFSSYRGAD
jgi:hypothetical protein